MVLVHRTSGILNSQKLVSCTGCFVCRNLGYQTKCRVYKSLRHLLIKSFIYICVLKSKMHHILDMLSGIQDSCVRDYSVQGKFASFTGQLLCSVCGVWCVTDVRCTRTDCSWKTLLSSLAHCKKCNTF